ncbi:MAG: ABC transporter ATP-binding protein [Dehalococcoidia bacterium]
MPALLEVSAVTKRYGATRALDDVTFELQSGRVLAVLGANGAGKTTLIRCVTGTTHFEGTLSIDGVDVRAHGRDARRLLGYLPQHAAFHADLTVRETAEFYADLRRASHVEALERVAAVGLADHLDKRVNALSGGMRQRLALAVALLTDPPLLVLDEPAAGLDIAARIELRHLVREQRARGKTILMSTHWLEDVPYVADDVLVLEGGRCEFLGTARAFAALSARTSNLYLRVKGERTKAVRAARTVVMDGAVSSQGDWLVVACGPVEKGPVIEALVSAQVPILDLRVEEVAGGVGRPVEGGGVR